MFTLRLDTPRDNLQRLWVMRNIALVGQASVISVTEFLFHIPLPVAAVVSTVVLLAAFNGFTWLRLRHAKVVGEIEIFGQFWVDLMALTSLLYFTGGATNPFISFYLPILAVAAAALAARFVWFLSGFSIVAYVLLAFNYIPLEVPREGDAILYHLSGMFVNFVIGTGWIAWFVLRMSSALRDRDAALGEARARLMQDARSVALGAQAARAAHELGTPLATIAIAAGEMRTLSAGQQRSALDEEIHLIETQVARCKTVLDSLREGIASDPEESIAVKPWFAGYLDDWKLAHPNATTLARVDVPPETMTTDIVVLGQVLRIILENAVRVSESVDIRIALAGADLELVVTDRGPGIPDQILERLGRGPVPSGYGGRGLGLFLAFTALDARGGRISIESSSRSGASTTSIVVLWPLRARLP